MPIQTMTADEAERIAVQALTFLAGDEERLGRFIDQTGHTPAGIRQAASEPGFFLGVMQHIVDYEPRLLEFAAAADLRPEDVAAAARTLGVNMEG